MTVTCFDRRTRTFNVATETGGKLPLHARWVVSRSRGVVHCDVVADPPARYFTEHTCWRVHRGQGLGTTQAVLAGSRTAVPQAPPLQLPDPLLPEYRLGYRWLAGPAHVVVTTDVHAGGRRLWGATSRALCGAAADEGASDRERARAAGMRVCERCAQSYDTHLGHILRALLRPGPDAT